MAKQFECEIPRSGMIRVYAEETIAAVILIINCRSCVPQHAVSFGPCAPYGMGLMVMLSSRRGPMEMISIGQPMSSSSLFT